MATIEEVTASVTELTSTLEAVDVKLDEIKAFILSLSSPAGVVTQAQLDELAALVDAAKGKSSAVLAEADALDEPAAV